MKRPPRLRAGDTVGVIAPGGAVGDRDALARGAAALEGLGYRVRLGASVGVRTGYLAGTEALRRDDLLGMFAAADVRAVFCARGGYGVTRLLPLVDPAALARDPKVFIGYSDVSPLLVALVQNAGLVAFHGPMVATDLGAGLDEASVSQLTALLGGADGWETAVPTVVRAGVARGTLVGGCLSLLAATAGTPWALRGEGIVLFLEDVAEPPYRIDRMLTQLRQAGCLTGVRGVVFGAMTDCRAANGNGGSVAAVAEELGAALGVPVGLGLPSGHGRPNLTLPFGMPAEIDLDAGGGVLRVRGAAVT
jgi:muramoyltetrapeptide carboxypeptidase